MAFEANVKLLRERRGLTQAEVAESLGVTQAVVAQYELGARVPNIKTAVTLAKLLGTTCEELVEGIKDERS